MRAKHALLALSSLPLISACSFLLDFDSLQGGKKSPIDAGADSGGSPAADGSGAAGASGTADESAAAAGASCAGATWTN